MGGAAVRGRRSPDGERFLEPRKQTRTPQPMQPKRTQPARPIPTNTAMRPPSLVESVVPVLFVVVLGPPVDSGVVDPEDPAVSAGVLPAPADTLVLPLEALALPAGSEPAPVDELLAGVLEEVEPLEAGAELALAGALSAGVVLAVLLALFSRRSDTRGCTDREVERDNRT